MNVLEINKYPPMLLRNGRFLNEDWTSVSQLGEPWGGAELTAERYLAVEDLYVSAMERFAAASGVDELRVHGLEFWDERQLPGLALPPRPAPRDGDRVSIAEAGPLLRRFLRELAWAELVAEPRLLIHPGYDLRLLIATTGPTADVEAAIVRSGLFVHRGQYDLPTLDTWGDGR